MNQWLKFLYILLFICFICYLFISSGKNGIVFNYLNLTIIAISISAIIFWMVQGIKDDFFDEFKLKKSLYNDVDFLNDQMIMLLCDDSLDNQERREKCEILIESGYILPILECYSEDHELATELNSFVKENINQLTEISFKRICVNNGFLSHKIYFTEDDMDITITLRNLLIKYTTEISNNEDI